MTGRGMYILIGQSPVAEPDVLEWGRWMETADRVVFQERVGGMLVSTVFLGLDHNFLPGGEPILFETMVFVDDGSGHDLHCERCSTWLQAEEQHRRVLAEVKERSKA